MQYSANFHRSEALAGNAITSGDTLKVHLSGAGSHATGAIYHEGFPIQIDFDDDKDGSIDLNFKLVERVAGQYQGIPKGTYVLKIRAGNGQGIDDEFYID
jgi:hypothetical protein